MGRAAALAIISVHQLTISAVELIL